MEIADITLEEQRDKGSLENLHDDTLFNIKYPKNARISPFKKKFEKLKIAGASIIHRQGPIKHL